MMACFGLSWPLSVYKSYTSRSAKGKSLFFEIAILIGYIAGIAGKFYNHNLNYALVLYFINIAMVSIDVALYFRNRHYDKLSMSETVA